MFYVYEWFDTDTNTVFYVGKGTNKRYLQTKGRNKLFADYIANHKCKSRIIKEFENENDAFAYEHERICFLKSKGGCFCNLDNGGAGGVNFVWTEEMRKYKSIHNPMKNQEQRRRMSENNPMKSKEVSSRVNAQKRKAVIIKGIYFDSIKSAGEYFGKFPTQVQKWCKRGYDSDKEPCRYANEEQKDFQIKTTNSKKVIVDGVVFDSVANAARHYGVWSETIIRAIKNNSTFKGHTCKYDNQQPSQGNSNNSTLEGSTTNE